MNIEKNVEQVQQDIQACQRDCEKVRIVAATKYVNVEQMKRLYDCGITIMGENRVDALLEKKRNYICQLNGISSERFNHGK